MKGKMRKDGKQTHQNGRLTCTSIKKKKQELKYKITQMCYVYRTEYVKSVVKIPVQFFLQ